MMKKMGTALLAITTEQKSLDIVIDGSTSQTTFMKLGDINVCTEAMHEHYEYCEGKPQHVDTLRVPPPNRII